MDAVNYVRESRSEHDWLYQQSVHVSAQFREYALHWRFVERGAGKYSYFSGEKVSPFGRQRDPGWLLDRTEQEFRWDPSGPVQTLKDGDILLFRFNV